MPLSLLLGVLSLAVATLIGGGDASASRPQPPKPNPAPRLIFWVDCEKDVVGLSNAELDSWKARGVDGFVCMTGHLHGLGGDQEFTANPDAVLHGAHFQLQRALTNTEVVRRARARGLKMYLGAYLVNYFNRATPLDDWFKPWSDDVLPRLTDLAGAARSLGFAGLAFDQELYPQAGGAETASWGWDYPGNRHTEAEVRAQARERGAQVMQAILAGFPKPELAVYSWFFPGGWNDVFQDEINSIHEASADRVDIDFWDGMTSVDGYRAIRFFDATFYKAPHVGTWNNALTYLQNNLYATFSQRFSNWRHAWSKVHVAPFAWIDPGPMTSTFDDARSPAYVAEQLAAFRRWAAGGEFANFAYGSIDGFNYSPYTAAMQEASSPVAERGKRPTLAVTDISKAGRRITAEGTAHDDLALRAVHWRDDAGHRGVARLDWEVVSGGFDSRYDWQTRWSIATKLRKQAKRLTIYATDITGLSSQGEDVPRRGRPAP